jgi:hypothetical protein
MTKLLKEIIDRVRAWPEERQDQAALMLIELEAQEENSYRLTPDQVKEVERIRRDVHEGRATFATERQMDVFWEKCGL